MNRTHSPRVHVLHRGKHFLSAGNLLLQESLEIQKLGRSDFIFEMCQPRVVQRVNLEFEQFLLLVSEFSDPCVFVEFGRDGRGLYSFGCCICCCITGRRLGLAKERRDAVDMNQQPICEGRVSCAYPACLTFLVSVLTTSAALRLSDIVRWSRVKKETKLYSTPKTPERRMNLRGAKVSGCDDVERLKS